MLVDFSKNRITEETLAKLQDLAKETELADAIKSMFSGEKINFRQILQFRQRLFGDAVFGEIHQHQIIEGRGEFVETIGIFREQLRDGDVFHFIKMFL